MEVAWEALKYEKKVIMHSGEASSIEYGSRGSGVEVMEVLKKGHYALRGCQFDRVWKSL